MGVDEGTMIGWSLQEPIPVGQGLEGVVDHDDGITFFFASVRVTMQVVN
jgi:hypothetical protein